MIQKSQIAQIGELDDAGVITAFDLFLRLPLFHGGRRTISVSPSSRVGILCVSSTFRRRRHLSPELVHTFLGILRPIFLQSFENESGIGDSFAAIAPIEEKTMK